MHHKPYRNARRAAYPKIYDQLDAMWKALAPSRESLPAETIVMLDEILAVKAKYPKGGIGEREQKVAIKSGKLEMK